MEEQKDTNFGIENKKENARKGVIILVIETVVIIVLASLVLGVLNYFRIFPLDTILPQLFSDLPQQQETQSGSLFENIEEGEYEVKVESEVSRYEAVIADKEGFIDYLNELEIFDRAYSKSMYADGSTGDYDARGIIVKLVDEEQSTNKYARQNNIEDIYSSSEASIVPGGIIVRIHISKEFLEENSMKDMGKLLQGQTVRLLYKMKEDDVRTDEEIRQRDEEISEIVEDLYDENYLQIRET